MNKSKVTIIATLLTITIVLAQFPSYTQRIYWPGMWHDMGSWGNFKLDRFHPDTLSVSWTVHDSNPLVGYPYHPGNVSGINDTVLVRAFFDNRTAENMYIGSSSPEDWFYPVLYDPNVDVFTSPMLADTSAFEYRFEHWVTMMNDGISAKPDTIYCLSSLKLSRGTNYGIVYSIWGVGTGTFRVILKPTASKPAAVTLALDNSNNYFIITEGQDIKDTLNSYSNIAANALRRREYTLFNTYVSNIFNLNSQSLIGWALRYHGYDFQSDTANALIALDSVLYNIDNRIDPLIPDTSRILPFETAWLMQWSADYRYFQSRLLNPDYWKTVIPL